MVLLVLIGPTTSLRGTTATSTLASPPSVLLSQLMWHCWRRNLKGLLGTRGMLRGDMPSQEREPLLTGQKSLKLTSSSAHMLPAQPWMNLLQNAPDQHWKGTGPRKRRGDLLLPRRQSLGNTPRNANLGFRCFVFGVILWCFGVISHSSIEQNISPSLFSECYGVHGVIMFLVFFVVFQYSGVFS